MSAYVVHMDTIDLIVSAANRYLTTFYPTSTPERGLHGRTDHDEIGQMLLDQNYVSVNYRYRRQDDSPGYSWRPVSFEHIALGQNPDALVLASIRCLRYQSCETPDYAESDAARLLDAIEAGAIRKITADLYAPWGWTREAAAERERELRAEQAGR